MNRMHVSFMAIPENESFGRVVVSSFASQLDPTLEDIADLRTAVSEAVTNAIIHGYEKTKGMVDIDCVIDAGAITITVSDKGKGIENIELAMQPFYTNKPSMERSGMGFSVMEAFMDSVDVVSEVGKGTSVTMYKRISGDK